MKWQKGFDLSGMDTPICQACLSSEIGFSHEHFNLLIVTA